MRRPSEKVLVGGGDGEMKPFERIKKWAFFSCDQQVCEDVFFGGGGGGAVVKTDVINDVLLKYALSNVMI